MATEVGQRFCVDGRYAVRIFRLGRLWWRRYEVRCSLPGGRVLVVAHVPTSDEAWTEAEAHAAWHGQMGAGDHGD